MIERLQLQNFRSCFDTSFDLGRSLCAISGRNGVGKSNVLKAIEWICSSVIVADSVRLGSVGNASEEGVEEVSVKLHIEISGSLYEYFFSCPVSTRKFFKATHMPNFGLQESLHITRGKSVGTEVFQRQGELIQVPGRVDQIRIPRTTPAIAAMNSLLALDDPIRSHVENLTWFFNGVRYYSLDDRPDAKDYVTEQVYNDWKFRYQSEGQLTNSVAVRLIYMWQEEKVLFDELLSILGPDGLDLIDHIDVMAMERPVSLVPAKDGPASSTKLFLPLLKPSEHMAGAGTYFPFSDLSVGTRRVIRILASMLFDRRSLMLLEQPEDSIHPGLLRKLIDQMRTYSFETQILFTTHSLEVLDILKPEEILLATAPLGATTVRKLTPAEIERAKHFLQNEGTLSDFLEPLDES